MTTPIPAVSARKYPGENAAFPVKFRLKGEKDGPVYRGQTLIVPCAGCNPPPPPALTSPPVHAAQH